MKNLKNPPGGARLGAGRKKGGKNASTITKEAAREVARQLITAELRPLIAAQVSHAKGLKYLMIRDKEGKFTKVTAAQARHLSGGEIVEVWEKDPSVQAFTDLMNRALDKAAEQRQELDVTVHDADLLAKVQAARKRLGEEKAQK